MEYDREMAERLRQLCAMSFLDIGDFIEYAEIPPHTLDKYYAGDCGAIPDEHLRKLAAMFRCSPEELCAMLKGELRLKGRYQRRI